MSNSFEKSTLFNDDDSESENGDQETIDSARRPIINTENAYAQKYNDWRRKEELQKLKDKYGESLDIMSEIEDNDDDDSGKDDDSDSDDETSGESLSEEPFDEDFFNVYSALKNKDPKIYDKNFKFYNTKQTPTESETNSSDKLKESSKETETSKKKLTLHDYHKKLLKEKKGVTEEDEFMNDPVSMEDGNQQQEGYYEELYNIKKNIKDIFKQGNDEDEDNDLFSIKDKYHASDKKKKIENDVSPKNKNPIIPNVWTNDNELDENEKFLKQYILNKGYSNNINDDAEFFNNQNEVFNKFKSIDSHFKVIDDDNQTIDDNGINSQKIQSTINVSKYHYEEPDATLIKRYPRNISSIRDMANKDKKSKRAEIRERKKLEKEQELKRLRKLKREEIENKIKTLKSVSDNEQLDLKDLDLNVIIDDENDFDPDNYDRKMQLLFGDDYYNKNADDKKPVFEYIPEIDDELNEESDLKSINQPKKKKTKKEIKKNKDIMADDDIGLYDDLVGGEVATRFRYRMVEPNDFGLTDEEILFADDKELNKWCSLKKMSQYRSKENEVYDQKVYSEKAKNINLKKKILKSLYDKQEDYEKNEEDYHSGQHQSDNANLNDDGTNLGQVPSSPLASNGQKQKRKRKRSKKKKNKNDESNQSETQFNNKNKPSNKMNIESSSSSHCSLSTEANANIENETNMENGKKSRKRKRSHRKNNMKNMTTNSTNNKQISGVSLQRLKAYGFSNRELKRIKNK